MFVGFSEQAPLRRLHRLTPPPRGGPARQDGVALPRGVRGQTRPRVRKSAAARPSIGSTACPSSGPQPYRGCTRRHHCFGAATRRSSSSTPRPVRVDNLRQDQFRRGLAHELDRPAWKASSCSGHAHRSTAHRGITACRWLEGWRWLHPRGLVTRPMVARPRRARPRRAPSAASTQRAHRGRGRVAALEPGTAHPPSGCGARAGGGGIDAGVLMAPLSRAHVSAGEAGAHGESHCRLGRTPGERWYAPRQAHATTS
jgi:hypothetical protein